MGLNDEIREQPFVVERLLTEGEAPVRRAAELLRERSVDGLHIAARGTSDHAAIYAQYLLGARNGLPVALAAPSLVTLYGAAPRFGRAAVVGISQSGASPDVVGVVEAARAQGAPTVAITNDPSSPLAEAAEIVLDLRAGVERAVAATKTYTAELTVVAMLSAALDDNHADAGEDLGRLPAAIAAAVDAHEAAEAAAAARGAMAGCIVLGRGFEYATAREWALKIKELARVMADPYSAADFQHGPVALMDPGFTVLAVATSGTVAAGMLELLGRLREEHGADVVAISDRNDVASAAILPIPAGVPEWLLPIVSIVPGQLFAAQLARARGLDPEAPRHIRKVTLTR
ncbi:MAG TPA: SIS domain-containing protein [Vitreimonas sp.]|nr:SIS domain-containing protein [Vitreimonas sp.]